ncbi:MAG: FadR family transcriptional regulator [Clostridiales bacterium]|nr:FadR family transcriptional regulator [Clostridiales bacterium]
MDYSNAIQKIEKNKLVDNVIEQMNGLIEHGAWKEGDKIASENQLARDFNVSRVVIREALQSLRSRNLIVTRHGLGSFVCNPRNFPDVMDGGELLEISEDDFLSLQELRLCVENRSIQLSAEYGTEEDFARIHEALERMKAFADNLEEFTAADLDFHLAVVESGHSKLLIKAYHSCQNEVHFILREMNRIQESQTYALYTHTEVYQAIAARDAKRAMLVFKDMGEFNKARYSGMFKNNYKS